MTNTGLSTEKLLIDHETRLQACEKGVKNTDEKTNAILPMVGKLIEWKAKVESFCASWFEKAQ